MNAEKDSFVDATPASDQPGVALSALAVPLLVGIYLILTSTRYLLIDQNILDAKRILEIEISTLQQYS